jgi:hypothetical protein
VDTSSQLLLCVANEGAEDLQVLKLYRRLPDAAADARSMVRIIDDSGEDYLYPRSFFVALPLPPALEQQLAGLAVEQPGG